MKLRSAARLCSATLFAISSLTCGSKNSGNPTTPTTPTPATAVVAVSAVTAQGTKSATGFQYSITVRIQESGGVAVTVSSVDLTFTANGSTVGTVQFDAPFTAKVAANGTATSKTLLVTDDIQGHAYAAVVAARVTFTDDNQHAGSATASNGIPALPAAPTVDAFTVSPATINAGQTVSLQWTVSGATDIQIDGGVGAVASSGQRTVSPSVNTTYTLTASGLGGTATRATSVTVTGAQVPPAPTVNTFTGDRSSIAIGESIVLQWSVSGATSVSIDNGVGGVGASGTRSVTPLGSTDYRLTASNAGGSANRSVSVSVSVPSGICAASTVPSGTTAVCNDGATSQSQNRSGTCSSHSGVRCWVCPGALCSGSVIGIMKEATQRPARPSREPSRR